MSLIYKFFFALAFVVSPVVSHAEWVETCTILKKVIDPVKQATPFAESFHYELSASSFEISREGKNSGTYRIQNLIHFSALQSMEPLQSLTQTEGAREAGGFSFILNHGDRQLVVESEENYGKELPSLTQFVGDALKEMRGVSGGFMGTPTEIENQKVDLYGQLLFAQHLVGHLILYRPVIGAIPNAQTFLIQCKKK